MCSRDITDIKNPVVLDCGSNTTKVGFAGDHSPTSIFDSLVGYKPFRNYTNLLGPIRDYYVGDEKRGILRSKYPIVRGIVNDWDPMEKMLHHALYNELVIQPELHPVVVNEAPFNSKQNREKITQVMFETLHVPAFYAIADSVASLLASGLTTGIVVKSGAQVSCTSPIYEGHVLPHAISTLEPGGDGIRSLIPGKDDVLDDYFLHHLVLEDVMKKLCYVAIGFERECEVAKENPSSIVGVYGLPTGTCCSLSSSRFRCTEPLFRPSVAGLPGIGDFGIHEVANQSIMKCPSSIRETMYKNMVLSGGSTMFPGFGERLTREMNYLTPDNVEVKVIEPENRDYSSFTGESIFASLDTFPQMWISNSEYEEYGPGVIHRKCF